MNKILVVTCLFAASLAGPVLAANANRPFQNCDRKVDNCGPTGNDMTDRLNAQQLGGAGQTAPTGSAMPMEQGAGGSMPIDQGAPTSIPARQGSGITR